MFPAGETQETSASGSDAASLSTGRDALVFVRSIGFGFT
jgi:hypothetical protein